MKNYFILLSAVLFFGLQQYRSKPAGNSLKKESIVLPMPPSAPAYIFDTFIVIRTRFDKPGTKATAKDTFVLIEKEFPRQVSATRVPHWYHIEAAPYDPNGSDKTASAAKDTIIWTRKPYKP